MNVLLLTIGEVEVINTQYGPVAYSVETGKEIDLDPEEMIQAQMLLSGVEETE